MASQSVASLSRTDNYPTFPLPSTSVEQGPLVPVTLSESERTRWKKHLQVPADLQSDVLHPPTQHLQGKDNSHGNSSPTEYRSEALEIWEGTVISVGSEHFDAELEAFADPKNTLTGTLALEAVTDEQRCLVQPGAVFHWSIYYEWCDGRKRTVSEIIFRQLPAWRQEDLEAIANQVRKRRRWLLGS